MSHRSSERTPGDEDSEMECIRPQSDEKQHAGAWKSYKIWNKIAHRQKQITSRISCYCHCEILNKILLDLLRFACPSGSRSVASTSWFRPQGAPSSHLGPLNNWCNWVQLLPRCFFGAAQQFLQFCAIFSGASYHPQPLLFLGGELIHLLRDRGSDPLLPVLAQKGQTPCPTVYLNGNRGRRRRNGVHPHAERRKTARWRVEILQNLKQNRTQAETNNKQNIMLLPL